MLLSFLIRKKEVGEVQRFDLEQKCSKRCILHRKLGKFEGQMFMDASLLLLFLPSSNAAGIKMLVNLPKLHCCDSDDRFKSNFNIYVLEANLTPIISNSSLYPVTFNRWNCVRTPFFFVSWQPPTPNGSSFWSQNPNRPRGKRWEEDEHGAHREHPCANRFRVKRLSVTSAAHMWINSLHPGIPHRKSTIIVQIFLMSRQMITTWVWKLSLLFKC